MKLISHNYSIIILLQLHPVITTFNFDKPFRLFVWLTIAGILARIGH